MKTFLKTAATVILAAALAAGGVYAWANSPSRPYTVGTSPGGNLLEFVEDYDRLRRTGRPVIVDGMCISACTLVVGLIPYERMCLTPFAQFAFHSAWRPGPFGPQHSPEGTRLAWQFYPEAIRAILRLRGWDGAADNNAHPNLIYVTRDELRGILRFCA